MSIEPTIAPPTPDPWNIGTLHKGGVWAFYSLSNYIGVVLCAFLIYSVYRNKQRVCSDIYVASLSYGCMVMSATCGVQCSFNLAAGRFVGGNTACQIEAIAHVSNIIHQFFSVTCLFINMYFVVVKRKVMPWTFACIVVVCIFVFCLTVTGLLSLVSPIYLMSGGLFCFLEFSSPGISAWLVPSLLLALGTSTTCHVLIVRHLNAQTLKPFKSTELADVIHTMKISRGTSSDKKRKWESGMISGGDIFKDQFKWRSTLFILALLVGWGSAAITTVYEFAVGRATEGLVTAVGVGGVSFSVWAPVIYYFTSDHYKQTLKNVVVWLCTPCLKRKMWWQQSADRLSGDDTTATSITERVNRGGESQKRPSGTTETTALRKESVSTIQTRILPMSAPTNLPHETYQQPLPPDETVAAVIPSAEPNYYSTAPAGLFDTLDDPEWNVISCEQGYTDRAGAVLSSMQ